MLYSRLSALNFTIALTKIVNFDRHTVGKWGLENESRKIF